MYIIRWGGIRSDQVLIPFRLLAVSLALIGAISALHDVNKKARHEISHVRQNSEKCVWKLVITSYIPEVGDKYLSVLHEI